MTTNRTRKQKDRHIRHVGARLALALKAVLQAANVGERSFWNATQEARAAIAQWEEAYREVIEDSCDTCFGSGGGPDPAIECRACGGTGLKR